MSNEVLRCSRCQAVMEPGFLLENGDRRSISQWVQGAPERGLLGGVKTSGCERREVYAMRCTRCGLLELYASEQTLGWFERY